MWILRMVVYIFLDLMRYKRRSPHPPHYIKKAELLIILLLTSRLALKDRLEDRGVEFDFALIGVKSVYFLLDVGKLSVAKAADCGVIEEGISKAAESFDKFLA